MPPRDFDERIRRMREVIRRRVADYDQRHRYRRFAIRRLGGLLRSDDPRLSTVMSGADALETTIGDFLSEPPLGAEDRERLREFIEFLILRFDLLGSNATPKEEAKVIDVDEADFVEREFDYPRPHHVWIVPNTKAAAGSGIEIDRDSEVTEVLHSIRDVYNGRLRVIRVIGDSMSPVLHGDDKVTFDTRLVSPKEGDVVVVYDAVRGGMIGYWRRDGATAWLDKANGAFSSERLDTSDAWKLWGTITRIVDTPVSPRRRPRH
ncbi:MAG TPA: S24/S26 family peptidase [Thermoanaerobaculia bacterium]|jgi:hypothetical protein